MAHRWFVTTGDVVHSWKVRYFVLTKSHLKYFAEKRQGCKPIKSIPLVRLLDVW